ncbi:MAG: hypothetical protein HY854_24500 [Burkholderiales bacterium]|nr:hypothetical protein [Burkholderiales bacterium]
MARRATACLLIACACALAAGCRDRHEASNTAVLGGAAPAAHPAAAPASVPAPTVPRNATPEVAITGEAQAVAVWEENGVVMASRYTGATGWTPPQALERIGGEASNAKVAANGRGVAMAIWRHSVGRIDSLRFSRWQQATGWSTPDVMPGALPRPRQPGKTAGGTVEKAAPRIEVDAQGNARAEWPSGFADNEMQVSTFVRGEGWARPVDVPLPQATQQSAASN